MESYTLEESVNNDFLSQSYSQGVEKITGTNHFNLNFEVPKEVLNVREKTWKYLFDKYSEQVSDDAEITIITCESETEVSETEFGKQEMRMCKPASMIQYWINTGNPPYEAFLNENEDIGSSLSEQELESISSQQSLFFPNKNKQEYQEQSSSSSVDTAAYILSNANVTKKTDAMAIIEGAKCPESSRNMKDIKTISNNKTEYIRNAKIDQCDYSDDNINVNGPNIEISPTEHVESQVYTQESRNREESTNTLQSKNSQYSSCVKIDEINTSKSSLKGMDIRNIHDIASIFQKFDTRLKRLSDKENNTFGQNSVNKNISNVRSMSADNTETEMIENNTTTISQRKKLYTKRDSPIDLMLTNKHSINRLSEVNHYIHPALDTTDCMIPRKSFLKRKNKNKRLSLLSKKGLHVKKKGNKKKRKQSKLVENNRDNDDKNSTTNFSQNLSNSHNSLDDNPLCRRIMKQKNNDTNNSAKDGIFKQDVAFSNLNPVISLEKVTPSFTGCDFNFVKNNRNAQENGTNNKYFENSRELHNCNIQNVDHESRTSNTSSIIVCKCGKSISQEEESSSSLFNLKLSDDDRSVVNVGKKVDELLSLKNMILAKSPRVVIERLPLLPSKNINTTATLQVLNKNDDIQQKQVRDKFQTYSYGTNKIGSINLKENKASLSQINTNCTTVKSQISSKNNAIREIRVLRSKARFFNSYKVNNKSDRKLREVRVVLERLPANIHLKRSITNVNLHSNTNEILQNISLYNNKIKSPIKTKSFTNRNTNIFNQTKHHNYSLRMRIKSKKNDKLSDISDIVSKNENQVSDTVKSDSTYKCSILSLTSSDEDDFVTLFQQPNKRFKRNPESIDNETLNEVNTINNKHLISSSKNLRPRKTDNSVKNLSEQSKRVRSVINTNKSKHLDTTIKRNEIDCKNNSSIIFQTKLCYTDSSYSEESNSYTTSRKQLKGSSMYSKSRYSNRMNKGRLYKDSIGNRYITNSSNSNSSIEKHNNENQSHNKLLRLTSSKSSIQVSKQLANEEFNNISLRSINNTKKNSKSPFLINDKQDISVEKESFVKTLFGKNNFSNFSENTQNSDKFKSSVAMQQSSIKPSVTNLLRFQTKTYYDSSSSISS